jgi:ABC-type Fe3+-citrate transport system substrate-binding protein
MFSDKRTLGFIAQEVEKVLPEIVQTENTTDGYKSVQYDKVVALLVEAMKEQQKQINQLKKQVKKLRQKH